MALGENIKLWRNKRELSLRELAEVARSSKGNLSDIETGKVQNPSVNLVYRISLALDVPMALLMRGE